MGLSWRCRTVTATSWLQIVRRRWRSGWSLWNWPCRAALRPSRTGGTVPRRWTARLVGNTTIHPSLLSLLSLQSIHILTPGVICMSLWEVYLEKHPQQEHVHSTQECSYKSWTFWGLFATFLLILLIVWFFLNLLLLQQWSFSVYHFFSFFYHRNLPEQLNNLRWDLNHRDVGALKEKSQSLGSRFITQSEISLRWCVLILAVSRLLLPSHLIWFLIVIFHQMMTPPARAKVKVCWRAWGEAYTQNCWRYSMWGKMLLCQALKRNSKGKC